MTNPPFGGEEQRGILGNFPRRQTDLGNGLLFLQLIMRKLRRPPKPGRAAIVVPKGTLFGDGICARIKEELLKDFNMHTMLAERRLHPVHEHPDEFLFFDRSHPTEEVWYLLSQCRQCVDDVSDRRRHADLIVFFQPSQSAGVVGLGEQQVIGYGLAVFSAVR